jgi:hypothetical protein
MCEPIYTKYDGVIFIKTNLTNPTKPYGDKDIKINNIKLKK